MPDLVVKLLTFVASNLDGINAKLSSAILGVVATVLVVFIQVRPPKPSDVSPLPPIQGPDDIATLKKRVDDLTNLARSRGEVIRQMETNPKFRESERLYFNFNGVTNAGFILAAGFLAYNYFTVSESIKQSIEPLLPKASTSQKTAISSAVRATSDALQQQAAMFLAALALSVLVCLLVTLLGHLRQGRSSAIINRAFQLSLLVSIFAALFTFGAVQYLPQ
ncbi:hypothetical protein [Rhizobium ruizarguesonis]|uniref:hypothetical protein n=1 Tax=Rhizobium ruizarguesonis TaxID=2081791 RepID=UPI00102F5F1B|nr:hypothetical protein [Rhizobium ruizarguesonis]TBE02327.1 hypothetical protein ELH10_15655 [Rhizobium ruizarguesonis]TBF14704.1 hypothetical protein ELG95_14805 [Rhizobium ruizarguesonis]